MRLVDALYADGSKTTFADGGGYNCCYQQIGADCFTVRQFKGPFNNKMDALDIDGRYEFAKNGFTIEWFSAIKMLKKRLPSKYKISIDDEWNPGVSDVY